MPTSVVIGAQWGDEGKGKIVDSYAKDAGIVVRFQGGNNAGHTIETPEGKTVLHLIPSGILHEGTKCVIANGTVVDPWILAEELEGLKAAGHDVGPDRLLLHPRTHLILPWHRMLDSARESLRGDRKIGTTGRGIGPAYEDKVARFGVQAWMLGQKEHLMDRLNTIAQMRRPTWNGLSIKVPSVEEVADRLLEIAEKILPFVQDPSELLDSALKTGEPAVLFEGAQGAMLDLDYGTYPYVTSSNTITGGVCTGAGIGPRWIHHVVGVFKAYCTRVGEGPFPTEIDGDLGEEIRAAGNEYGATTGRPRRCGWVDLPALRFVIRHCGMTMGALTKLDVLSGQDKIPVCVAYELNGERLDVLPMRPDLVVQLKPIFEELEGWKEDISGVRNYQDLPEAARRYVEYLSDALDLPYASISVGPGRDAIIPVRNPYTASIVL